MRIFFVLALAFMLAACRGGSSQTPAATDSLKHETTPVETVVPVSDAYWNELAQFLGGLSKPSAANDSVLNRPEVKAHFAAFQRSWATKDSSLLRKLNKLSSTQAPNAYLDKAGTVLYPFSGPDFMHVYAIFPNAKRYVLFGLEPEGRAAIQTKPHLNELSSYLPTLDRTLDDIMVHTFFKTNDMRVDLRNQKIQGTLPVLLAFMARHNCKVLNVKPIVVNGSGAVDSLTKQTIENPTAANITGVEIAFLSPKGSLQSLQYFSVDVSDGAYTKQKGFQAFLKSLKPTYTYMKSASYLLHASFFGLIREQILDVSKLVLQDDTGMPLRYFASDKWTVRYYGKYQKPISLFANRFQPDLFRAYNGDSAAARVHPLDFRMGYNYYEALTNLQLAEKK
jgi:hypothetical protein